MKIARAWFVLLTVGICKVAAQVNQAYRPGEIDSVDADRPFTPLENRNGWVNPEDLAPMPQCVAQQDTTTWLHVMTQCVWRQCTRHFGVFCTHHQWLIQLSCLSTVFSSDVVREYLPHCSRSVLAKAQLFQWVHTITGRTWLVDIGDAIELQSLSPSSLTQGYADVDVTSKAPTCLTNSVSVTTKESFQYVMGSCGFTADTQHTGNARRPWEYNEGQRSLVALDSETVGYDLTHHIIAHGSYFDRQCFCKSFGLDFTAEPCSGPRLATTRERLWMFATCGSTSLPNNWTEGLQTTITDYIPTKAWRWPACVNDMPNKVIGLTGRCTTDACSVDRDGYCEVERAVDRSCFCRSISYDTCKGSCHIFETRIEYVNWLHDICGSVEGWHGLPKHWHRLASPTTVDMIPWDWNIKPSRGLVPTTHKHSKSSKSIQACPSTDGKIASLVLINLATLVTATVLSSKGTRSPKRGRSSSDDLTSWSSKGLMITNLYLLTNWMNASLLQSTPGYGDVPIIRLLLLWCSMPRLTWLIVLLVGVQPWKATGFSAIASSLFVEVVFQALTAFHIIVTVSYGWEHNFYNSGMERLAVSLPAQFMYAGALMWLFFVIVSLVLLIQAFRGQIMLTRRAVATSPKPQATEQTTLDPVEELMAPFNERWVTFESKMMAYWINKSWDLEEALLLEREKQAYTTYGTLPVKSTSNRALIRRVVRLYLIALLIMILLFIAQWIFWIGFIGLSADEYCPPNLAILTVIWTVSSVGAAVVSGME